MRLNFQNKNNTNYIMPKKSKAQLFSEAKILAYEWGGEPEVLEIAGMWQFSNSETWREAIAYYNGLLRNRRIEVELIQRQQRLERQQRQQIQEQRQNNTPSITPIITRQQRREEEDEEEEKDEETITRENMRRARNRALREEREVREQQEREKEQYINNLINNGNFNEIMDVVIHKGITLKEEQAEELWNEIQSRGKYIMIIKSYGGEEGTEKILMVNEATKEFLTELWVNGGEITSNDGWGSDMLADYTYANIESITIEKIKKKGKKVLLKDGKFFGYINTTRLDLLKYQIYTQEQAYDEELTDRGEHCLLYTLNRCGVSEEIINTVKLSYIVGCSISKKDIKNISSMIGKNIKLYYVENKEGGNNIKFTLYKCGEPDAETIEIAIYKSHYFKYEKTEYSKYSINNYDKVKNEFDFGDIYRSKEKNFIYDNEKAKINSLSLVMKIFNQGYFQKLDLVKFAETAQKADTRDHIYLGNIDREQKICDGGEDEEKEEKEEKEKPPIFYADCETYVTGDKHELQLLGVVGENTDIVDIMNVCDEAYQGNEEVEPAQLLINKFLNILTGNGKHRALCYFHNLKYDFNILIQGLNIKNICEKDKQIYSVIIIHKNQEVELRDSYKIIPFALSQFQGVFELGEKFGKKEAISYEYYTRENNNKRINIVEYADRLSVDEQLIFYKQIAQERSYDKSTNTFNPLKYYKDYLKLDCLVLKKGVEKFNKLISKITNDKMNVYQCLTISSLTDKYLIKLGAYKGVYKVKGNLRAYIGKAVYGGRVCVNKKYKKKIINGKISDYDGVSLYPSAINRLCREMGGLPTGKAKRLENLEDWNNKVYCVLTVKILKVNKEQQMPFIAHKTKDSIIYTNLAPEEEIIIDSTTLQDYIKFHKIEYKILDGVYWDGKTNPKISETVRELFKDRLRYKTNKPALANILKLMLNSLYGKTIMKKTKTKKSIVPAEIRTYNKETKTWTIENNHLFDNYIYNNFNTIKSYRKMNNRNYEVETICSDNTYNRAHIGCSILSTSKRIMNEVFDIANTNNYPIYYTDTDSLHCNYDDVKKLEDKYEEVYNKKLNGKQLEQFHTDFDLKDKNGVPREGEGEEIYASKSIFLGKKSYMDCLESKDKDGNRITGFHIRLKGITKEGLEHSAKEYKNGYVGLYEELAQGVKKRMILNPFNIEKNKNKVLFEFKEGTVRTKKEFIREVKF
jgi:hypothetical protein